MKQFFATTLLFYFKLLAKVQLLKNKPLIIGVTGSAGKTSALEAIFAVLKNQYLVKKSDKANSESGIPLNILGITPKKFSLFEWLKLVLLCPLKLLTNWEKYEIYLVEMGIDSPQPPKNMEYLLSILTPTIGVFLNAAPTHAETFDYLVTTKDPQQRMLEITKLIAKEKGKIVTRLAKTGTAVLNTDQQELFDLLPSIQAQTISFGQKHIQETGQHITITDYAISTTATTVTYLIDAKTFSLTFADQALPKHFAQTCAAALAVGRALKVPLQTMKENLETYFKVPPGRSSIIKGVSGSFLIDSSYNASLAPTLDMLELLSHIPSNRKIALLGDMRELGEVAQAQHELVAQKASELCDSVILVGPLMQKYALPLLEKTKTQVYWFTNAYQAAEFLRQELKKDDLVLIKGSQNTLLLEIAVELLMANPEDAEKLLPRRGEFWDKKRLELKS